MNVLHFDECVFESKWRYPATSILYTSERSEVECTVWWCTLGKIPRKEQFILKMSNIFSQISELFADLREKHAHFEIFFP